MMVISQNHKSVLSFENCYWNCFEKELQAVINNKMTIVMATYDTTKECEDGLNRLFNGYCSGYKTIGL